MTPSAIASAVIAIALADIRLLITFAVWPWPGRSPTTKIVDASSSSSGRTASTASGEPATIIVSRPASAPAGPPLTGASTQSTPSPPSSSATSSATGAPVVDRST